MMMMKKRVFLSLVSLSVFIVFAYLLLLLLFTCCSTFLLLFLLPAIPSQLESLVCEQLVFVE